MIKVYLNGWNLGLPGVGQGVYTGRLLDGLQRHADTRAWSFTIYVTDQDANKMGARFSNFRMLVLPTIRLGHPLLDQIAWNMRITRRKELRDPATIFFSPSPFFGSSVPARTAVTHHDCIYRHFPVYLGKKIIRRRCAYASERFLHKTDCVFTQSDYSAADIHRWTGAPVDRIKVIPAWLPPEYNITSAKQAAERVRTKYGLPARYWLYVGGYDVRKNVDFLIRAYARARLKVACPPIVFAGKIPAHPDATVCNIQHTSRECKIRPEEIIMPGYIDDSDLPGLYGGAGLFIYPSLSEGYGLPPLEAMGCGCPAWVADNSSLREVVRDVDYRFRTDDTAELAEKMTSAARRAIVPNPSFNLPAHSESHAIHHYLQHLAGLITNVN